MHIRVLIPHVHTWSETSDVDHSSARGNFFFFLFRPLRQSFRYMSNDIGPTKQILHNKITASCYDVICNAFACMRACVRVRNALYAIAVPCRSCQVTDGYSHDAPISRLLGSTLGFLFYIYLFLNIHSCLLPMLFSWCLLCLHGGSDTQLEIKRTR